jgi:hypothetical protein
LQVPEINPGQKVNWYAVVANAEFMLHDVQNEAFAEQLRERRRYLKEKNIPENFFLVSEPTWLDKQFPDQAKRVSRPCVALISTDKQWIKFMKLRLDRVLELSVADLTPEEALQAGAPIPEFKPLDQTTKWTAPYPPYAPGWWDTFVPKKH